MANVMSIRGGKVHSPSALTEMGPRPMCNPFNGSGRTKFVSTSRPVDCEKCLEQADHTEPADELETPQAEQPAEAASLRRARQGARILAAHGPVGTERADREPLGITRLILSDMRLWGFVEPSERSRTLVLSEAGRTAAGLEK